MWYYESGGASQGPVEASEIRRLISLERVTRTTRVWREGFTDWLPAGQTEFAAAFPGSPGPQAMPAYPQPLTPYPGYLQQGYTGHRFAGFWIRAGAYMIDVLVIGIVGGVIIGILTFVIGGLRPINDQEAAAAAMLVILPAYVVVALGGMLYVVLTTTGRWQGTLGKRAVGIYVLPAAGGRVGFGLALGRYFAHFITSLIPFGIGYMMAGWTNEKRALHDMICDTRVVYGRP